MDESVKHPEQPVVAPEEPGALSKDAVAPAEPTAAPEDPEASKKRGSRKPFLLGALTGAAVVVLAGGIGLALDGSGSDSDTKAKASASPSASATVDDAKASDSSDDEGEFLYNPAPSADDFAVKLKTTSKHCFGSAGCNVTVEPDTSDAFYVGILPLDPDATISITYEISGDESGPITETMEVVGGDQLSYHPTSLSTQNSGVKVTVKVTDVESSS